jgi:pimeloyl-ACP methyl ester carboxylesterase
MIQLRFSCHWGTLVRGSINRTGGFKVSDDKTNPWLNWPGNPFTLAQQATDYWVDAAQRSILFMDVLRQRGDERNHRAEETAPHVLSFAFEVVMDGRHLERPVNYGLLHILQPDGIAPDPCKRPFIVFDPRAGHGPGIGGMKHDSEIGVVLKAGHPCYFVGFLPNPVPGQTIEDVCRAEAQFIARVAELHPKADGKPALIGNCQAGWQIMMTSALNPDLVGPLVLAGAPLSYWAGVRGKNPLRYLGGVLGGTWMTALAGDLGNGIFDGAQLVENFEKMNPSNTLWSKNYNVYSRIDTEAQRFLDFEKWWGNPVLLNAGEMQYIADSLFVGNRLSDAALMDSAGHRIDLRNIKSPIVVFCSWGDDITPPQQALGWVLDLYEDDAALVAGGQTIIYSMHQSIGHLGIFVSASVANKEHEEFTAAMDMIDIMPPGLYEAVFLDKDEEMLQAEIASGDLAAGDYVMRFERRGLDVLRALGGNDVEDERRFATVARVSEINQGLYRTFASPLIKTMVTEASAEKLRESHPLRMRYTAFSSKNPLLNTIPQMAERVRAERRPVAKDNVFLQMQEAMSAQIVDALDRYRDMRDQATENIFLGVYGSPVLQALVGLKTDGGRPRRIGRDIAREAAANAHRAALALKTGEGGVTEAIIRGLLYIYRSPEMSAADERAFATIRQLKLRTSDDKAMSVTLFKSILRDQYLMLQVDEEAAMRDLPMLLPQEPEARAAALAIVRQVAGATGTLTGDGAARLDRVAAMFEKKAPKLKAVQKVKAGN